MGFQARTIVGGMPAERLQQAAWFALAVILCLILVRMAGVLAFVRLAKRFRGSDGTEPPPTIREAVLIGWCGMRGLVTLATAFALPADFPQRDLIVLTAFVVVLATLVVQGLTLGPLVRLLGLDRENGITGELAAGRVELAEAALAALNGRSGPAADHWRQSFEATRAAGGARLPRGVAKRRGWPPHRAELIATPAICLSLGQQRSLPLWGGRHGSTCMTVSYQSSSPTFARRHCHNSGFPPTSVNCQQRDVATQPPTLPRMTANGMLQCEARPRRNGG
jgi:hypothetical protein